MLQDAEAELPAVPLWGRVCDQSLIGVPSNKQQVACWRKGAIPHTSHNLVLFRLVLCTPNHPYGSQDTPRLSSEVDGVFLMTLQWHGRFRGLALMAWALSSRRNVHSLCHQFRFQPLWLFPTSGNGSNSGGTNPDASGLVACSTSQQRFLVQYWCCLLWVLHEHDGRVAGFWLDQGQQGPAPSQPSWSWIWRFQDCRVVFWGPPSGLLKRRKGRTGPLVRCLLRTFPRPVYRVLWAVQNICSASNRSIEFSTT